MTVHALPSAVLPDDGAARRTAAGRWKLLLVLLVCASPVIASYLMYYVVRPQTRANYATLVEPARDLPRDLPLADLDGRAVNAAALTGQWLLVSVGGGACGNLCEQQLLAQRQLREMMGRERDRIDKVWLVIDDVPLRTELRAALAAAPATTVLRVPRGPLAAWLQPEGGQALEAHLYLVDPMGRWMMRTPAKLEPSKFRRDLDRLLRASSSWDQPGR
jgi:hypothetical protein